MRAVLITAGFYNLLWGAWVIFFPTTLFGWLGINPINYPEFWQCLGMIVGVYGVGYLIAAENPQRHWPIVLVGLLGKVLGPLGMGWSIWNDALPLSLAWMCVWNDLVWWVPFGLILLQVKRACVAADVRRRKLPLSECKQSAS